MLLLLVACGGGWTRDAALSPVLVHLDTDGDGKVSREEYERVAWRAPPFPQADADGDGALSVDEVDRLVFQQDPITFDGSLERLPPDLSLGPGVSGKMTVRQRLIWETLTVLREDVRAAKPGIDVPGAFDIQTAAMTGSWESPESQALLVRLRDAWASVDGLTFPPTLAAAIHPAAEGAPAPAAPEGTVAPAGGGGG